MTHHGTGEAAPLEALLWPDPELALVHADMTAYEAAHPCACDALCVCESAPSI